MKKSRIASLGAGALLALVMTAGTTAPAEAASKPIVMTVSSATGSTATIHWYSNFNSATLEDHSLPWTKKVSTAGYVHSISASDYSGDEVSLTCTIRYKGKTVRTHTVTGSYVTVSCDYNR